jgi:hypothetical protein
VTDLPIRKPKQDVHGQEVLDQVAAITAAQPVQRPLEATDDGFGDVAALARANIDRLVQDEAKGIPVSAIDVQRWSTILADAEERQPKEHEHDGNSWAWLTEPRGVHRAECNVLLAFTADGTAEQRLAEVRKAIIECALYYARQEEREARGPVPGERGPLLRDPRQAIPGDPQ